MAIGIATVRHLSSGDQPYKPLIDPKSKTPLSPQQVYERLLEGHRRFLADDLSKQNASQSRRYQLGKHGQYPMATVLCCSDSRTDPALLFDCGLGELFVVRVAGHVPAQDQVASCEFSLKFVGTPLLMVLGHSQCAAVHAAVTEAKVTSNIERLVLKMKPLADLVRKTHPDASWLEVENMAIRENVKRCMSEVLDQSPVIRDLIRNNEAMLVGGVYDLESGNIEWIDHKPIVNRCLSVGGRQWKLMPGYYQEPQVDFQQRGSDRHDSWRGIHLENGHPYEIGDAIGYLAALGIDAVLDTDKKYLLVPSSQLSLALHALTKSS